MKCTDCKIDYPAEILAPFCSTRAKPRNLCGVCALVAVNETHGTTRSKFSNGSLAEAYRKEALRLRAKRRKGDENGQR